MKVALVHDDLVQWGGAERMLLLMSEVFPEAPIFTSVVDFDNPLIKLNFGKKNIKTSFLQKIPGWRNIYKPLLPLYPIAFEQFDFSGYDVVISQTTRFAKSIITKPQTLHICYCHTPPRFLWDLPGEKIPAIFSKFVNMFRVYDKVSACRVDIFLAGSKNAQTKIKKIYGRNSKVLYPFCDNKFFTKNLSFDGGYFLIIARLNSYKRVDIAVDVFNKRKERLIVVGDGPEFNSLSAMASSNIWMLGKVSEDLLHKLIQGCKGLIISGEEDFGLTSLEAQASGKGVIAFGKGGSLETVLDKKTGILFDEQSGESLNEAVDKFLSLKIDPEECVKMADNFSEEKFKDEFCQCIMTKGG